MLRKVPLRLVRDGAKRVMSKSERVGPHARSGSLRDCRTKTVPPSLQSEANRRHTWRPRVGREGVAWLAVHPVRVKPRIRSWGSGMMGHTWHSKSGLMEAHRGGGGRKAEMNVRDF